MPTNRGSTHSPAAESAATGTAREAGAARAFTRQIDCSAADEARRKAPRPRARDRRVERTDRDQIADHPGD